MKVSVDQFTQNLYTQSTIGNQQSSIIRVAAQVFLHFRGKKARGQK
jgi:hypothetical protein